MSFSHILPPYYHIIGYILWGYSLMAFETWVVNILGFFQTWGIMSRCIQTNAYGCLEKAVLVGIPSPDPPYPLW